jgi:hypothetical protein
MVEIPGQAALMPIECGKFPQRSTAPHIRPRACAGSSWAGVVKHVKASAAGSVRIRPGGRREIFPPERGGFNRANMPSAR